MRSESVKLGSRARQKLVDTVVAADRGQIRRRQAETRSDDLNLCIKIGVPRGTLL